MAACFFIPSDSRWLDFSHDILIFNKAKPSHFTDHKYKMTEKEAPRMYGISTMKDITVCHFLLVLNCFQTQPEHPGANTAAVKASVPNNHDACAKRYE